MTYEKENKASNIIEDMLFEQHVMPTISEVARLSGVTEKELESMVSVNAILAALQEFGNAEAAELFNKIKQEQDAPKNIELLKYLIAQVELASGVDKLHSKE